MALRKRKRASGPARARLPTLQVALEPVDDPLEPVDPPVGAPGIEKEMELVGVAHHFHGPAETAQDGEGDLRLLVGTALVALGLKEEEWRLVPVQLRSRPTAP